MKEKIIEIFKVIIYPVFIYLNIDYEVIGILCLLMLLDSLTGGIKVYRLNKLFKFKILLWGIILKILMLVVPIVVALLGKGINYDLIILVDMVMRLMIVSETYSILGNIYSAKNKVEIHKIDAISIILKSIRKTLFIIIQTVIKKIETASDCRNNE